MLRRALFAALIVAGAAFPAAAQDDSERLLDFASDITVQTNGTLDVVETIAVNAQGDRIDHGIYRDFPTLYTDKLGRRVRVRFDVQSVTMDGHNEHYEIDGLDNGKRVKIGDADTHLDSGKHVFVITYITDRQVGFFDGYDEIYWNVTGNGWNFQIDHASATVHLPEKAKILQSAFYTGPEGGTGKDATAAKISDHEMRFETTSALGPEEGLTIAVGFKKGIVAPPSATDSFWEFIEDNASAIVALAGITILFLYYMITWARFGRDPQHGTIIPLFSAPKDFSPAAVRYVHRMGYDRKAYAASLVDMAVKGFLTISEDKSTYKLVRTGKDAMDCGLSTGERAIATSLFDDDNTVELKQENHTDIAASIAGLQSALKNEYDTKYFVTNFGWFAGGIAILAVSTILSAVLSDTGGADAGLLFWIAGWSVGTSFLVYRAFDAWRTAIASPRGRAGGIASAMFLTVFAVPFVIGLIIGVFGLGSASSWPTAIALVLGGIMAIVFFHLLKAPTALGGHIRDEIDGFKIFLDTAEKDRLEQLNPPDVTPAVFEKFLPYAMALDCENAWSKKFESQAAAAAAAAGSTYVPYTPLWYTGSSFGNLGAAGFASSIGSALGSAAASSSSAPGSSSGSGGGGFSGGGGGGGGGGGW